MMTCEQIKSWMMDSIYEELSEQQKPLFEEHLRSCSACRKELSELRQTSATLAKWPEAEPAFSIALQRGRLTWRQRFKNSWLGDAFAVPRWAAGFAMAAVVLLFLLAAFNTQLSSTGGHWQVRMSLHEQPAVPVVPEGSIIMSRQDLLDLEQERWKAIQAYMQQSESKQRKEWSYAMSQLAQAVQAQRSQDLHLVSKGLQAVGKETAQRLQITDQVLAEVLRLASADQTKMQ
jgi:hypothetical protein